METVRCGKERVVDQLSQDIHSQHKSALIHFVLKTLLPTVFSVFCASAHLTNNLANNKLALNQHQTYSLFPAMFNRIIFDTRTQLTRLAS